MADTAKKRRGLSEKEIDELALKLVESCKDMKDNEEIDSNKISKQYNVSLSIVDKVYIKAIARGLPKLILVKKSKVKSKSDIPFINGRESIMIGKSTIYSLNEELGSDKFKPGDKFEVSLDGKNILLKFKGQ